MRPASSLRDLLEIRKVHAADLHGRLRCLGTAVGIKYSESRRGPELDAEGRVIPAVICFVEQKVDAAALDPAQLVPPELTIPSGLTCATDVVTGHPKGRTKSPAARLDAENRRLVRTLDEGDVGGIIGGLPISSPGGRGTIGCVVRRRDRARTLGLLTNWHVAGPVGNGLFRPDPQLCDLGVTKVSIRDVPGPSYHRIDGAFVQLPRRLPKLLPGVHGLAPLGPTYQLDLAAGLGPIGERVVSVGQTLGQQTGTILAYGYDWLPFPGAPSRESTDYLIVGDAGQPFGSLGDSGKLVVLASGPHSGSPVGLLWGGDRQAFWTAVAQGAWNYASDLGAVLGALKADIWDGS